MVKTKYRCDFLFYFFWPGVVFCVFWNMLVAFFDNMLWCFECDMYILLCVHILNRSVSIELLKVD